VPLTRVGNTRTDAAISVTLHFSIIVQLVAPRAREPDPTARAPAPHSRKGALY
jgi:hypothetical protein